MAAVKTTLLMYSIVLHCFSCGIAEYTENLCSITNEVFSLYLSVFTFRSMACRNKWTSQTWDQWAQW